MPDQPTITCKYEAVKYGNLTFNSFNKVTLNHQNVYTEDNMFVKHVRCTLEVDFIITNETIQYTENVFNNTLTRGIDLEVDYIREQLLSPNKELILYYHGAGTKLNIAGRAINNTVTSITGINQGQSKNPLAVVFNTFEGPYPEVLTWEPLGANNAARCKWRCVFNIPVGPVKVPLTSNLEDTNVQTGYLGGDYIGSREIRDYARTYAGHKSMAELVDNYLKTLFSPGIPEINAIQETYSASFLVSHTEEQECEIDEDGTAVVTLTGNLEFSGSGSMFNKLKESPTAIPRLLQFLNHYFEPLHPTGFTRTQKYKYKKTRREIEYTIVDREIKSDNPILPNIVKASVSHTVNSNLLGSDPFEGMGFTTWNNTFEGDITVRPGVWKGWAWIAMMCIVRQRMQRTQAFQGEDFASLKDSISGIVTDVLGNGDAQVKPRHLLHKISIKEDIYTREVNFSLSYMTIHNLNSLFLYTGLFFPVHIAWNETNRTNIGDVPKGDALYQTLDYNQQWGISREFMANTQNVFGYRGPLLPGYDILFNPYDGEDPNRFKNSLALNNPERRIVSPDSTVNFVQDSANVHTFAERRRNAHYSTYDGLSFPNPNNLETFGGPSPVKEAVGNGNRNNTPANQYKSHNPSQDTSYLKDIDPKDTWLSYDTKFIIHREENSVMFPSIQPQLASTRQNTEIPYSTQKDWKGYSINGATNPEATLSGYEYSGIQAFGQPVTYIQFTGRAMRAGYSIPCPVLVGCKNPEGSTIVPAFRVGRSQFTCYQANKSSDMPIFQASWNVMYALKGDPSCQSIGFEANRSNRFA
jgi:hypothetical protein